MKVIERIIKRVDGFIETLPDEIVILLGDIIGGILGFLILIVIIEGIKGIIFVISYFSG